MSNHRPHTLILCLSILTVINAYADDPQKPKKEKHGFGVQGLTFTTVSESTDTSLANPSGKEGARAAQRKEFKGVEFGYGMEKLQAGTKGSKVRGFSSASASAAIGTGNLVDDRDLYINGTQQAHESRGGSTTRYAGGGSYSRGVIFGKGTCGPYVGGNISGGGKFADTSGSGKTLSATLGGGAEGGLACASDIVALVGGVYEVRRGLEGAEADESLGLNNSHAYGVRAGLGTKKLLVRLEALRDTKVDDGDLFIPGEVKATRVNVRGTYRPFNHLAVQGDVGYTRNTDKNLPDPSAVIVPVGSRSGASAGIRAMFAF